MSDGPPAPPAGPDEAAAARPASRRRRSGGGFRRRDALHGWTMHFGPNMTPMVDVVMVILIFFMASAAFMGSDWFLQTALPTLPGSTASRPRDPLELPPVHLNAALDVAEDGQTVVTFLELQRVPLERFLERMGRFPRGPETAAMQLLVTPTQRVPYRDVVRVHEAAEAAGIYKVQLGVSRGH
ncbi:MAG TPA: biopolymer transporter ExbD [Phycisphaerales bacterium]|nr:biopolymer transporter ExbD [Phycisphaerales bacterium]